MSDDVENAKRLRWWMFLLVVVAYLAIIQGGSLLLGNGIDHDDKFATATNLLRTVFTPVAVSSVFAVAIATWLGWWPQIIHEKLRVQKWLWFIPITFIVTSLLVLNWPNLFDQKVGLVLALLLLCCVVGFTEELMFRGIGLVSLRGEGLTEAKVAIYSSLIFGAAHMTNAFGTGATALVQAAVVSFSGYFLYLIRRIGGTIWLAMGVHAIWDFGLISSQLGVDPKIYLPALIAIPVQIVIGIILIKRRKKIEPDPAV